MSNSTRSLSIYGALVALLAVTASASVFDDITQGTWYTAGLSSGFSRDFSTSSGLMRTTTVNNGSATITGNDTSGYTTSMNAGASVSVVFTSSGTANTLLFTSYRPAMSQFPGEIVRAILYRPSADLLIYEHYVLQDSPPALGALIYGSVSTLIFSRTQLAPVNLASLSAGTYVVDQFTASGDRADTSAALGRGNASLGVTVAGNSVGLTSGASTSTLSSVSAPASAGGSSGLTVLRSASAPFFGEESVLVSLGVSGFFYASIGITADPYSAGGSYPNYNGSAVDSVTSAMGILPLPSSIPEPSSFAALAGGAGLLATLGRRRRRGAS